MTFTREDRLKGTPGRLKNMGDELPSATCADGSEEIIIGQLKRMAKEVEKLEKESG